MQAQTKVSSMLKGFDFGTRTEAARKFLANEHVCNAVDAIVPADIVGKVGKTGTLRAIRMVAFIVTGDYGSGSAKGTGAFCVNTALAASMLILASESGRIEYSQVHRIAGILREGRNNDQIKGVSKARLNAVIGLGGTAGTVAAQVSSLLGSNGLFTRLGLVAKTDKSGIVINREEVEKSALLTAYGLALQKMSDGALRLIAERSGE